jgi:putative MATE family efflux protein
MLRSSGALQSGDKPIFTRLMKLALPIMAGNFLQTLYNLTDAWFLGRLDAASLSAPAVAMPIIWFLTVFAMGFSIAGTTLISQSKGSGSPEKVNLYLGQMTFFLLILSFVIGFIGVAGTGTILSLMKTPEEVAVHASVYMRIIFSGLPFMFLTIIQQASYQGVGNGMVPLLIQVVSVALNMILDPLLIFGAGPIPALGVAGAAWATLSARSVAAGVSLILLTRGYRGLKLTLDNLKPRRKELALLVRIGLPASLGQGMTALGFTVLQGVINGFGTPVIAAFGIGNRLIGLFNMPAMGLSQATAALVGQALGGRRKDEARHIVRLSQISVLSFLMVTMTLTFFWGNHFTQFFVNDPEVIGYGTQLFRIVSISVVFFGMFTVFGGAFQGGGYTKAYMILNIIRLWGIRLPLAWILGYPGGMGPAGIWWAMCASNIAVFIAGLVIFRLEGWTRALDPDNL